MGLTLGLAIAGIVATVAATGVAVYAQHEQAEQAQEQAKYNRKVAEAQGITARQAADAAEQSARERDRRIMAKQRAALGQSGVTTEGSPLAAMLDTIEQSEIEALRIRYGGKVAEAGSQADVGLQKMYGQQARRAGAIGAGSSILTGASSVTGQAQRIPRSSSTGTGPAGAQYP